MITREELHALVDRLPECEWPETRRQLLEQLAKHDPLLHTPLNAPEDDEPETEGERAAIEEVYADIRAGKEYLIPHEEVKRRALELP